MDNFILEILDIKKSSYYNYKKSHKNLMILIDKYFTDNNIGGWIANQNNFKKTKFKNSYITELANLLNIKVPQVYRWRKRKPLLFNMIDEIFKKEEDFVYFMKYQEIPNRNKETTSMNIQNILDFFKVDTIDLFDKGIQNNLYIFTNVLKQIIKDDQISKNELLKIVISDNLFEFEKAIELTTFIWNNKTTIINFIINLDFSYVEKHINSLNYEQINTLILFYIFNQKNILLNELSDFNSIIEHIINSYFGICLNRIGNFNNNNNLTLTNNILNKFKILDGIFNYFQFLPYRTDKENNNLKIQYLG